LDCLTCLTCLICLTRLRRQISLTDSSQAFSIFHVEFRLFGPIFCIQCYSHRVFKDIDFNTLLAKHLLLPKAFVTSPTTTRSNWRIYINAAQISQGLNVVKSVVLLKSCRPASCMADVSQWLQYPDRITL